MSDLVLDQKTNSDHRVANTVKVNDTLFMAAQKKKGYKARYSHQWAANGRDIFNSWLLSLYDISMYTKSIHSTNDK